MSFGDIVSVQSIESTEGYWNSERVLICVRWFSLGWNDIGDKGAEAIAEALKINTSLTRIG